MFMKKNFHKFFILILLSCGACGLSSGEKAEYQAMANAGFEIREKSPAAAAFLGILPGCGSFYTRQYASGVIDLLTWPWSVFWDPILGYGQAEEINYQASKTHVIRLRNQKIDAIYELLIQKKISQDEYIRRKIHIERRFDFSGGRQPYNPEAR
jgi:hypothetical protein